MTAHITRQVQKPLGYYLRHPEDAVRSLAQAVTSIQCSQSSSQVFL